MYSDYYENEIFCLFSSIKNLNAFNEAMKMWHEDIMTLSSTKEDILISANSLLDYWNIDRYLIVDVMYVEGRDMHKFVVLDDGT